MAKIISSTNNKGGVGKTSTIVNLSQILAKIMRKRVLIIDCDQQCNLSQAILGKSNFQVNKNAGELFNINSKVKIKDLIIEKTKTLHIIPGKVDDLFLIDAILKDTHKTILKVTKKLNNIHSNFSEDKKGEIENILNTLDKIVWDKEEWIRVLKKRLSEIENDYDYIFLDLPPSVARIPENAWVSSDYLLVPISDNFALNGTEGLMKKMIDIKRNYNDELKFIFFFNKVPLSSNFFGKDHVNKEYQKLIDTFITALDENKILSDISYVMSDVIRESRDVEKSYGTGKSLLDFKESKVLDDYKGFAKSFHKVCTKG